MRCVLKGTDRGAHRVLLCRHQGDEQSDSRSDHDPKLSPLAGESRAGGEIYCFAEDFVYETVKAHLIGY